MLVTAHHILLGVRAAQDHDRHGGQPVGKVSILLDVREDLAAIHLRQAQIEQNQVGPGASKVC